MQFLNPIALWGLTGMIVPLAIHLLSRKEGKLMRVGSIRHLEESDSKKFKSIRINEWPLLLLRCLLLTWIVFLVSDARPTFTPQAHYKWFLVEDGLGDDARYLSLRDSLLANGFELRSFSDGFPLMSIKADQGTVEYWKLLKDLRALNVDTAVVLAYDYLSGYHGRREVVPQQVAWLSAPPPADNFVAAAYPLGADSLVVREGISSSANIVFNSLKKGRKEVPSEKIIQHDTIDILIAFDHETAQDAAILQAALKAIDSHTPHIITVTAITEPDRAAAKIKDWLIWLLPGKPSLPVRTIQLDTKRSTHLFKRISGDRWQLNRRLNEDVALSMHLTIELAAIIFSGDGKIKSWETHDHRVVDERTIRPAENTLSAKISGTTPPSSGIWASLILITLAAERWVAYIRKQ